MRRPVDQHRQRSRVTRVHARYGQICVVSSKAAAAVSIAIRYGNCRCAGDDWNKLLAGCANRLREFVSGVFEQLFLKDSNLRNGKSVAWMQRHHVEAGVRVTGE